MQFGAFGGTGMAAGYTQQLAAIGMHPLQPAEAFSAPLAVGYAGELVVARMDKARFKQVRRLGSIVRIMHHLLLLLSSA